MKSAWGRLSQLSFGAQAILALAALAAGAGPAAIAQLLGLDPLIGLAGNLMSTFPLVLWVVGTPLALAYASAHKWLDESAPLPFALGIAGLLGLASLWVAIETGGAPATTNVGDGPGSGFIDVMTLPFRVLGTYLEVYGPARFVMAVLGGVGILVVGAYAAERLSSGAAAGRQTPT